MSADKYEMLRVLGSGSFGQAWLACRKGRSRNISDKLVVKKVQLGSLSEKELDQALTEVAILARCRHTNVIRYCDAYVDNGLLHVVMEYADGGDLREKLTNQQGQHLATQVILDWFIQICFALQYIHSRNILHRDLKTQNIFLTSGGIIKLGDFGISRVLHDENDFAQTAIGTPFYLSPEICQKKSYNHKSDMWSLGCVLYETCTLSVPFDAPNFVLLATKIVQCDYKPIPRQFGPILEDLVTILLQTDPNKRPSAEQVLGIPALRSKVQTYVQRQKIMVRSKRNSARGESPPIRRSRLDVKAASPGSPVTVVVSPVPMVVSPVLSRNLLSRLSTPQPRKPNSRLFFAGSPSSPRKDGAEKHSKDKVNMLKKCLRTPPGSAEIRLAKLKKLDGATPTISHLIHRQRAIQSAMCLKSAEEIKGPPPKLSLFHELSKKRAFSVDSGQLINSATFIKQESGLSAGVPRCVLSRFNDPL